MKDVGGLAVVLIYLDTECGFCDASISHFIKSGRANIIRRSISGSEGRSLCDLLRTDPSETIVVATCDGLFSKTAAYIELSRKCGFTKTAFLLENLPRVLCDAFYYVIGQSRKPLSSCLIHRDKQHRSKCDEPGPDLDSSPIAVLDRVMLLVGADNRAIGRRLDGTLIFEETRAPGGNGEPIAYGERCFGLPFKIGLELARMKKIGARR